MEVYYWKLTMERILKLGIIVSLFCLYGCNYFTYNPHSARQKYFARPHLLFMDAIVEFRELYGVWPTSLTDLSVTSERNKKIISDFQYASADFNSSDSDKLTVHFYNYKKDLYSSDGKIDLNAFHGFIYFFRSNGKFGWKVKMK